MAERRKYTEEDRAVALAAYAANENNLGRTAKFTGIPVNTIRRWVGGGAVNEPTVALATVKKGELADKLETLAHRLIDSAAGKIADASLQMVATSLGIAVDKMQILRSKPTEIIEDASLSDTERADRINAILDRARSRRAEQPAGSVPANLDAPGRPADGGAGVEG